MESIVQILAEYNYEKTMNKKVLVTGASKGIGKSIAKVLSNEGYQVYICARNEEILKIPQLR